MLQRSTRQLGKSNSSYFTRGEQAAMTRALMPSPSGLMSSMIMARAFGAAQDVVLFDVLDLALFFDHLGQALKIDGLGDAAALTQIDTEFLFHFHHDLLPRAMRLLRAAPVPSCIDLVTSRGPFKVPTA